MTTPTPLRRKRNPRCPKCKSRSIRLDEVITACMGFHVCEDGIIRRIWGSGDNSEHPHHIEAVCLACKHEWRLRGAVQVSEFDGWRLNHDVETADKTCECADV